MDVILLTPKSTDHTREYVPFLIYGKNLRHGVDLGTRYCFGTIANTVCDARGCKNPAWPGAAYGMKSGMMSKHVTTTKGLSHFMLFLLLPAGLWRCLFIPFLWFSLPTF